MPSTDSPVSLRWLRLLLAVGALGAAAAGQYWLSIHVVPTTAALWWSIAAAGFVVLYGLARDTRELPPPLPEVSRHLEWGLCAGVLGCGAFFTVFRLSEFPPGLNHDAAWEGMYAIRILKGLVPYQAYANEAWGRETFTFYLRALSIWLMGATPMAVIAPSVVAGVLILPFMYGLGRNMFGTRVALVATLALGFSGWHLIFSRTGWRSDFQPLFTTATCYFFIRGMSTASSLDFALSGIALALTLNTYNGARLFPVLFPVWIVVTIVQSWHWRGFLRRYGVGLACMIATFSVVIAPLAWYAMTRWVQFTGRAMALMGTTSLLTCIKETLLLFNYHGNGDDFFTTTPGLEFPAAMFLGFGVLWALAKIRDERAQFLFLGFLANALPGLMSKPNMNRNIGCMPFVFLFVALGVVFFAQQLQRLVPRIGAALAAVLMGGFGVAAMVSTYTQYLGPSPRQLWGYYPETTVLGKYMNTLLPYYSIWIGDTPYFPRDTMTFLTYQGKGNPEIRNYVWLDDVTALLRMRPVPQPGKGLAFILENVGRGQQVFAALRARYPKHDEVDLRYKEAIFAKALLVPREALSQVMDSDLPAAVPLPQTAEEARQPAKEVPLPPAAQATPEVEAPPPAQDAAGKLQQPRGLTALSDGSVVVCDFGNDRLQSFDRNLAFVRQWGHASATAGNFKQPCDVAVGPTGDLFVADTWNQRVQVFSATGDYKREWAAAFFAPRGIAVDAKGGVFVADSGNNRVVRFSAEGQKEVEWGKKGSDQGELSEPVGIAVDANGQVFVADNGNGRVQVFTRDGKFVREFPVSGWRLQPFSEPQMTFDPHGALWVTVPAAKEVRNYDPKGKLLRTITNKSIEGVTFETPMGITYNPATKDFVVTDLAGRLVRIPYQQ